MHSVSEPIGLFDLINEIWRRKILIVGFALGLGVLVTAATFLMTKSYTARVLLAPASSTSTGGSMPFGASAIGSLASIANIRMPESDNVDEHLAILTSRQFIYAFIEKYQLLPVLFADEWDDDAKRWIDSADGDEPSNARAYRRIFERGVLEVARNRDNQLVEIAVTWSDPALAAAWANALIESLNDFVRARAIQRSQENLAYLQREIERTQLAELRQTIFALIGEEQKSAMIANTQKQYAFRILDPAVVPDRRSSPRRTLALVASTFLGGVFAVLLVLLQFVYRRQSQAAIQNPKG